MTHTIDFFKDEVRNGFYVSTAIKQAWAASLDVLGEIDRICEKHHIRYFADWGTLLGTVRHGGFIPWDDDLDICMLRDDYEAFRKAAETELPEDYVIHDYESHENHWLFLARVVNPPRMCFELDYLDGHYNFPWLAGVDIFLKDYLYPEDERERERDKEVLYLITVANGILKGSMQKDVIRSALEEIRNRYHVSLPKMSQSNELAVKLYKLAEEQMARVRPEETERIGQIFPWVLKFGTQVAEKKAHYDSVIRLPYEDTTIPVPAAYHAVLSARYGNYNEIRKAWDGHNYPFFEGQKEEMEQLSGEKFPGFTFTPLMLERPDLRDEGSLKKISSRTLEELKAQLADAEHALCSGMMQEFASILTDSQQLAAEYGTLVEKVKGEESSSAKHMVEALQAYCDALWEEFQEVDRGVAKKELSKSRKTLTLVMRTAEREISERREVLFLPIGPKEWQAFETYYEAAFDERTDVFVVPLPVMRKSFMGRILTKEEEQEETVHREAYPETLSLTDWKEYDPALHCPDRIYIQDPYDGTNPCLTIPKVFYAENLRRYSKDLCFIPAFRTAEFGAADAKDQYNLKRYAAAPGIVFADEAHVQSENIRQQYVNALTAFAGEETRTVWENRITADLPAVETKNGADKRILFCIGANELKENTDIFADTLTEKIRILAGERQTLAVSVMLYPNSRKSWEAVDQKLSEKIFDIVDSAVSENGMELIAPETKDADQLALSYDAYYGSSSPLVPAFLAQKKPVMLANYEIR